MTSFNAKLIFSATEGAGLGYEILVSDGTTSGTVSIIDTVFSRLEENRVVVKNDEFYFWGSSNTGIKGLYKTNGISGGAICLKDFTATGFDVRYMKATSSLVYFYGYNNSLARFELWRTDGTTANTYLIKNNFSGDVFPTGIIPVGDNLFFAAGNDLWKTDGSAEGTILLKSFSGIVTYFSNFKGLLFFNGYSGTSSVLWKSDGTISGTVEVTANVSNPQFLTVSNHQLFFQATGNSNVYGNVGFELFKCDGTENGTLLVKDIHPGFNGTYLSQLTSVNNHLFFFANGASEGSVDLWITDGTSNGTTILKSSVSTNYASPYRVTGCNGKLFYVQNRILWESDGTEEGTHPTRDDIFTDRTIDDFRANLTAVANQLFFTASNYRYGEELYAGTISKPGVTYYISIADGNWNNPSTWAGNVVPPEAASVIIRHNVVGNVSTSCKELRIEEPGNLTMNAGVNIKILE